MKLEEKLYTSTEVAKILGVSLRSVYRYLEQDKLEAEIKTATGRLRFTKQNILDFLYPDSDRTELEGKDLALPSEAEDEEEGDEEVESAEETQKQPKKAEVSKDEEEEAEADDEEEEPQESKEPEVDEDEEETEEPEEKEEEKEEEVDWLSKFKEAAQQYEESTKKAASSQKEETLEAVSSLGSDEPEVPAEEEEAPKEVSFKYYKSMLGGLKEIAQNVDKISRKSGVDYAFTLYSGLSLEKPLNKPFSILHLYIAPDSEQLFKKMLQLEETSESNAQVCLMPATDTKIFANKTEKHGLFVVSNEQLAEDFKLFGLEEELEELL